MCNLYSNTTAVEAMRQLFEVAPARDQLGNAEPRSAIWPKYPAPVVRLTPEGERELTMMKWGFLTQKLSKKTGKPISPAAWNNARADKVQSSGLWRESFQERRCLVPASSFREATGQRPATDYWFALKGDKPRPPFAFAGMWRYFQPQLRDESGNGDTHTIITTTPNELVQTIHPDRMPVILDPADYEMWLSGSVEDVTKLLNPYPAEKMQIVLRGIGVLSDNQT
jgi:putative SOS response-associated peptidase YedK